MSKRNENNFMARNWHSFCAAVFLMVVVLDLVIMPIWTQYHNAGLSTVEMVRLASTFKDGTSQLEALKILHDQGNYAPMTLSTASGNFFYTSFAAILSTAYYMKGKENIAAINARAGSSDSDDSLPKLKSTDPS